jgi:phosphoribosylformimino-5-aminoimidazole carboxamide ribotide isomerase
MAIAASAASTSVWAQTETTEDEQMSAAIEEIEVLGIRRSIVNSLDAKREADTIADLVDAGAMGALPDQSIADALGRIPGVTTVRDSGQSSQLNVRGMNGDFIQTTLNGREQASTSSYTENSRWMSFDQYPAELITQAAVYKSPKASHIEGGVAATVELKTANPLLAEKEHNFAANIRASFNDAAGDVGADESGERYSLSYMGKFMDDTLGVSLGYSHLEQPNNFVGSRAGADGQIGFRSGDVDGDGVDEQRARAFQWQAGTGNDIRDGYLAHVVWEPNENFKAEVNYFKTELESEDFRHGITVGGLGSNLDTFALSDADISGGVVNGGTVTITDPKTAGDSSPWFEARTEDQSTEADADSYGLNLEWNITDRARVALDISHSEGEKTRKDRLATMHAYQFGTATGLDSNGNPLTQDTWEEVNGQTLTYSGNGDETPNAVFSTDFTDLDTMRLSRYEEYPHTYTDEIDSYKIDFEFDLDWGPIRSVEVGYRASERVFGSERGTFLYGARDGQYQFVDGDGNWSSYCADNLSDLPTCQTHSLDGFVSVESVDGAPDHLAVTDLSGLADSIFGAGNYVGKQVFSRDWTFVESGKLTEKTKAYYLMANIDTEFAGIPVTGNFGVRVVKTDVKSSGVQNVGEGNGVPITDDVGVTQTNYDYVSFGPEYTDTLPSINLNFELSENDILRFAAAKVMGRPPSGQLKGGAGSWNGGELGGNQYNVWTKGSPYLDPFRAKQLDLSYEHYFEDEGAVTVALFWKDIESLVEGISYGAGEIDFASLGIETPEGMVDGIFQTFQNNDEGGYIRGIEIAGTKTFSNLPGMLSGLGITASYSYTESETEVQGGSLYGETLPLPGLSENVWSTTVYWEWENFTTHLNVRYRDEFVNVMPVPGSSTPVWNKEYTTMDYQASYAFDNGLSVVFQVNNLTDEASITSYGVDSALGEYKEFGRQYYLGLNYRY